MLKTGKIDEMDVEMNAKDELLAENYSLSSSVNLASQNPKPFLEMERGFKITTNNGFYGNELPRILTYDPLSMRNMLYPIASSDITVCNSFSRWMQQFIMIIYALFLMILLYYTSFPDGDEEGIACSESDPTRNKNICDLRDVMEDAKDDFQFLISFVLAGFVGLSVSLWNTRRSNYASLCGSARNLNILISSLLPYDAQNVSLMASRNRCARWVMLAMEFSVLKARGHMDSDEGLRHLQRENLIEDKEWEGMVVGDRHSTVFYWIMLEITHLKNQGIIPAEYVILIANGVSAMRAQANDLMSTLDRDKPIPYVSLCGLLVRMNIIIMSTWKAVNWAIWMRSGGPETLMYKSKFWIDILVLFVWNVSYTGLYAVGCLLHNPFGNRRIDVAHEMIFDGIRKLSSELSSLDERIPPHLKKM